MKKELVLWADAFGGAGGARSRRDAGSAPTIQASIKSAAEGYLDSVKGKKVIFIPDRHGLRSDRILGGDLAQAGPSARLHLRHSRSQLEHRRRNQGADRGDRRKARSPDHPQPGHPILCASAQARAGRRHQGVAGQHALGDRRPIPMSAPTGSRSAKKKPTRSSIIAPPAKVPPPRSPSCRALSPARPTSI